MALALKLMLLGWLTSVPLNWLHAQGQFRDVSDQSGIVEPHYDGSTGQQYIVEFMGAGVASLDYDRDGQLDLYFVNGSRLGPDDLDSGPEIPNRLYRNLGKLHFDSLGMESRSGDASYGLGVISADYNEDGFADLFVSNFGRNCLLRNNGDGTFSDVTAFARLGADAKFSAGACFIDGDADGDLDLFVGNYVDFSYQVHHQKAPTAYPFPPGPRDYRWLADSYFENVGDGQFVDRSEASGIAKVAGPTMGVIAGDFDGDGTSDIFAVCDGAPNHLFLNDGEGNFEESGIFSGLAYDVKGFANGSMGVDAGDVNGDLLDDLLVTTYTEQRPVLFHNGGDGFFDDRTRQSKIGLAVIPHVNWTTGLVDFDCDGLRDAFICNGHFLKNASELTSVTDYGVSNTLMRNTGQGTFVPTETETLSLLSRSSRGAVFDDLDGDGDIDVAILNCADRPQVLENLQFHRFKSGQGESGGESHWLKVNLIGVAGNRDAVGAIVRVVRDAKQQVATKRSGRGYQSHFGSELHFGSTDSSPVDLEITWPSGKQQVVNSVHWNQTLIIHEAGEK